MPVHPAYLEHQLRRCMRPDAHSFVRPDWRRHVRPGFADDHPFALYERKYSPDQPRVPAGDPAGGQWTSGGGHQGSRASPDTVDSNRPINTQFNTDERSTSSGRLIQMGGEDLGSFGNGISITKGPNVNHQEKFDHESGITFLSFTGVGVVVVDEKIGDKVIGSVYTVGAPTRPSDGLSVTIDKSGKVRVYPSRGG